MRFSGPQAHTTQWLHTKTCYSWNSALHCKVKILQYLEKKKNSNLATPYSKRSVTVGHKRLMKLCFKISYKEIISLSLKYSVVISTRTLKRWWGKLHLVKVGRVGRICAKSNDYQWSHAKIPMVTPSCNTEDLL